MNKITIIAKCFLFGIVASILLMTFSCDIFGTSIPTRISNFIADLNKPSGSRFVAENNFHSDISGFYAGEGSFIGSYLDAAWDNFSIDMIGSPADIGGGEKSQNGLLDSSAHIDSAISFHFKEDSPGNWKIHAMSVGGNTWGTF